MPCIFGVTCNVREGRRTKRKKSERIFHPLRIWERRRRRWEMRKRGSVYNFPILQRQDTRATKSENGSGQQPKKKSFHTTLSPTREEKNLSKKKTNSPHSPSFFGGEGGGEGNMVWHRGKNSHCRSGGKKVPWRLYREDGIRQIFDKKCFKMWAWVFILNFCWTFKKENCVCRILVRLENCVAWSYSTHTHSDWYHICNLWPLLLPPFQHPLSTAKAFHEKEASQNSAHSTFPPHPPFWRICWAGKGKKFFFWGKVGWDKVFRGKERMEEEEEKPLRISPLLLLPLYGQSFDKAICYLPVV